MLFNAMSPKKMLDRRYRRWIMVNINKKEARP